MEKPKETAESILESIQGRIIDAFDVFDHDGNKTVDIREVSTIIRSLGCCPTELELHDILSQIEEPDSTGFVRLERFLPLMTETLMEKRYRASDAKELLKAFKVLDSAGKGHITKDELTSILTQHGESFSSEEMEEMLSVALESSSQKVVYTDFVPQMLEQDQY